MRSIQIQQSDLTLTFEESELVVEQTSQIGLNWKQKREA